MLKKSITFTDYDGNERCEDFYFNINKAELAELQFSVKGGLQTAMEKAVKEQDGPTLMNLFKKIVFLAYGEKSNDGRRLVKSEELSKSFSETEAYVNLFMELATDENAAKVFMENVLPPVEKEDITTIAAKNA